MARTDASREVTDCQWFTWFARIPVEAIDTVHAAAGCADRDSLRFAGVVTNWRGFARTAADVETPLSWLAQAARRCPTAIQLVLCGARSQPVASLCETEAPDGSSPLRRRSPFAA